MFITGLHFPTFSFRGFSALFPQVLPTRRSEPLQRDQPIPLPRRGEPQIPIARNNLQRPFSALNADAAQIFTNTNLFLQTAASFLKKSHSNHVKPFSQLLLEHMIEARDFLLKAKIYKPKEIEAMWTDPFKAVHKLGLLNMLISATLGHLEGQETITFQKSIAGTEVILVVKCSCKHCLFELKGKLISAKKLLSSLSNDELSSLKKMLNHKQKPPKKIPAKIQKAFNEIGALDLQITKLFMNGQNIEEANRVDWKKAYQVPSKTQDKEDKQDKNKKNK
jgi:hypothetical protein